MRANNILIPIAIQKGTGKLVNAKDVSNGLGCDCYCPCCGNGLIAVNKEIVQKAHFRHSPESDCAFKNSFESYIHWLAKEVFRRVRSIELPPISFSDLKLSASRHNALITDLKSKLLDAGIDKYFSKFYLTIPQNYQLQKATKFEFTSFDIEKPVKVLEDTIRVDIILNNSEADLLIEPYLTNEIDEHKLRVIKTLDASVIAIRLIDFIRKYRADFTIEQFEAYIANSVIGKEWINIRTSKVEKLLLNIFTSEFNENMRKLNSTIIKNIEIEEKLESKIDQRNKLQIEINQLTDSLVKIDLTDLFKKKH